MATVHTLDNVLKTVWLTRPDLQAHCNYSWDEFEYWMLVNGSCEYKSLSNYNLVLEFKHLVDEIDARTISSEIAPLTKFMWKIWEKRPDLQEIFSLSDIESQKQFFLWYLCHSNEISSSGPLISESQIDFLNSPASGILILSDISISRLMKYIWDSRSDLCVAFPQDDKEGIRLFVGWFFIRGLIEYNISHLVTKDSAMALWNAKSSKQDLPLLAEMILKFSVESKLDLIRLGNSKDFVKELNLNRRKLPVLDILSSGDIEPSQKTSFRQALPDLPGVNLFGHAKGQLGIGEDVRMAAMALEAAGVPFNIYNISPGVEVGQSEVSVDQHISVERPYCFNMLCLTGMETARIAATEGSDIFNGRPTIGQWPWELPNWPTEWQHAYNYVDEIWAASNFTYEAYLKSCPKNVKRVPMAVDVSPTSLLTRLDFRLPLGRYLFVFSFDMLSGFKRKNPMACIRAFHKAFPQTNNSVGLVFKVMRPKVEEHNWDEFLSVCQSDSRIYLITETLERSAVLDLYRCCDCFISLHRSEGFGRGIIEAMMLGKPVITTGFSGNLDYCTNANSALVKFRLTGLAQNDYPFGAGQIWADPDIDNAAWWMRQVVNNTSKFSGIADLAKSDVCETHSPHAVGQRYKFLLGIQCT